MKRLAGYIVAVALLSAFAFFVWPTPYHYHTTGSGDDVILVKVHRLTGKTMVLTQHGWHEPSPPTLPDWIQETPSREGAALRRLDDMRLGTDTLSVQERIEGARKMLETQ